MEQDFRLVDMTVASLRRVKKAKGCGRIGKKTVYVLCRVAVGPKQSASLDY